MSKQMTYGLWVIALLLGITPLSRGQGHHDQETSYYGGTLNSYREAQPTVLMDFDGQLVRGTSWNLEGDIYAASAELSAEQIVEIFRRVSEDYRVFNLNITTDETIYAAAPPDRRIRIIITPSSEWYGYAAGTAFVHSFGWYDETPAWVFSNLLGRNIKFIAEAVSHEIGHALGLQHQSTYDGSCALTTEYAEGGGDGETGWAPIMGVGYYKNVTTWHKGSSILGCQAIQDDMQEIGNGIYQIGFRPDDHGDRPELATTISMTDPSFRIHGLINDQHDADVFRVDLPKASRLCLRAFPAHVGEAHAGANLNICLRLLGQGGDTICYDDNGAVLHAVLDTALAAGTYFLMLEGVGNGHQPDYGSAGHYTLEGRVEPDPVIQVLHLTGMPQGALHLLEWDLAEAGEIRALEMEHSADGLNFNSLAVLHPGTRSFRTKPSAQGLQHYRIRVTLSAGGSPYYTNTVRLPGRQAGKSVRVIGNPFPHHPVLQSDGAYQYLLSDQWGRRLLKGRLTPGTNRIAMDQLAGGIYWLTLIGESEATVLQLIKR